MKNLTKHILMMLSLLLFMSSQIMAQSKWAPIMMGDITTFVPYDTMDVPPAPVEIAPLSTTKSNYTSDEIVSVNVQMALSGDEDWVGIFPKGSDNSWGNVIKWNWVNSTGVVALNLTDYVANSDMPVGEYEVRLFYHNETGADAVARAVYGFSVNSDEREFGTEGPYLNKVKSVKTRNDENIVTDAIYYVEGEANLPTVIFMSGWKSNLESYDGFLKYIASLGYCVVAKQDRGECFKPNVYGQELSERLAYVHNTYNADITKLGIIGHSSGGGTVHYLMHYFKSNNIAGNTKSVVMSIDGWFPFGTTQEMLNGFDTPTLLMQFGGFDGINADGIHPEWDDYAGQPYHHMQDPKINLAIFKLLTHANVDKEYIVLEANNNHSYIAGSYNTIMGRQDALAPIDEFLNHTLGTGAAMNLIDQSADVITNDVISEYRYYCHIGGYNFCDLDNLLFQ